MSDISQNRVGSDGISSTPTSYQIGHLKIVANNSGHSGSGDEYVYDITNQLAYFEITESLNNPGLEVILSIGDSVNLIENINLQGSESLELYVYRKQPKGKNKRGSDKKSFTLKLRIAEIFDYTRLKPGLITYNIRAVSEHVYINGVKSLNYSFKGSVVDLIGTISKNKLNIDNYNSNGTSKNIIKGIYPNIRPINAICWLLRNAYDQGTPFFYYQTLADSGKVHLKSYKSILEDDDNYDKYSFFPFTDSSIELETKEGYEYERTLIRKLTSNYNQSKFIALHNGAYGSTLHTIDIGNKKYEKNYHAYSDSTLKLNQHPPFSKSERAKIDNADLTQLADSKNYFISLNDDAFSSESNYNAPTQLDFQKSIAYLENLNYQTHQIQIAGDFDLTVGKKIQVDIRKATGENQGTGLDKLQSGVYLITEIEHQFKEGFYQNLTIKKDSSEVNLDATR